MPVDFLPSVYKLLGFYDENYAKNMYFLLHCIDTNSPVDVKKFFH